MKELYPPTQEIQERLDSLHDWIEKQKPLLISTDRIKITLNIKGKHVVGEVTQFPD